MLGSQAVVAVAAVGSLAGKNISLAVLRAGRTHDGDDLSTLETRGRGGEMTRCWHTPWEQRRWPMVDGRRSNGR